MVNGSPFHLRGQVKPFSDHREASLDFIFNNLDIPPYLVYIPGPLPVVVERARLSSDIRLSWSSGSDKQAPALAIAGQLALTDVVLKDGGAHPLFAADKFAVDIERSEPLANPMLLRIRSVVLNAPAISIARAKNGNLNLTTLIEPSSQASSRVPSRSNLPLSDTDKFRMPQIHIDRLVVRNGAIHWQDDAVPGAFRFELHPFDLQVDGFDTTSNRPASGVFTGKGGHGENLSIVARANLKDASYSGHIVLAGVGFDALHPYYTQFVGAATVRGSASLETDFNFAIGGKEQKASLDKLSVSLKDFALADARTKQPLVSLPETLAEGAHIDLLKREVSLSRFASKDVRLRLVRGKSGSLNLLGDLQKSGFAVNKQKTSVVDKSVSSAAAKADLPWRISVGEAGLTGWSLHFDDLSGSTPVSLDIAALGLQIKNWSNRPGQQARGELSANVNKAGKISVKGNLSSDPLKGNLRVDLHKVDFLAIQPYVDNLYRILVTQGNVSAQGALTFDLSRSEAPDIRYAGNISLADFNSLDRLNNTDFIRWKRFAFDAVNIRTQPLVFSAQTIRLEDFYSRLILDAQGRLNVRELAAKDGETDVSTLPESTPVMSAATSAPVATWATSGTPVRAPAPQIRINQIVLADGHINYIDRFIKPNYEANLLALNGSLSGLSSDQSSVAALSLKASMDGAAPVTIVGQLNPLRTDGFLDIKADVSDVDLTGVSTYATKFVGYGIDKGKLSMSVKYTIRDRQLSAENHLTLDQLTFGKKVDSPDATKLPVLFAVSLLKDRHGVIDVNLPISGSLDDPQFSVGGVIVKVLVNLLSKAVTAPFSLLGSMFGSGEELSSIDFGPGSSVIAAVGEEKLSKLSKVLVDRPALKLEIAGLVDPVADVDGLKRNHLQERLRAVKAIQLVKHGEAVSQVDALQIATGEYPALLKAVYESEKIDAKPRNILGLTKTLPAGEMERIILANYVVTPAQLQALAAQRAQAVRTRLLETPGIEADRLFLRASQVTERGVSKPASARVDFTLQ